MQNGTLTTLSLCIISGLRINIAWNKIDDEGATALAAALTHNCSLIVLRLRMG